MLHTLLLACSVLPSRAALISPWQDSLSSASLLEGEHINQQWYPKNLSTMLRCADCVILAGGRDYTITEGTLLGATRDGFFLPWDSDGDIAFDANGPDGKEDIAGLYHLFTRRSMKQTADRCPMCKGVTLTHFMDNFKDSDGTELYWWQTFDDILVGNVLEPVTMHHRKISNATRDEMVKRILHDKVDSRIFPNPMPSIRDGPEYIDLEPFWIEDDGPEKGKWRNLQVSVDKGSMLPFQRCNILALLGETTSERVEVNCPSRPSTFLDVYYMKQWHNPPFNKYEDGEWVQAEGPPLREYLAKQATSVFKDLRPPSDSPAAGPEPEEKDMGKRFYQDDAIREEKERKAKSLKSQNRSHQDDK